MNASKPTPAELISIVCAMRGPAALRADDCGEAFEEAAKCWAKAALWIGKMDGAEEEDVLKVVKDFDAAGKSLEWEGSGEEIYYSDKIEQGQGAPPYRIILDPDELSKLSTEKKKSVMEKF